MTNHNPNRHPAGTPVGGRFAEGRKAGADPAVDLGAERRIELDQEELDYLAGEVGAWPDIDLAATAA